jgi:hypothetical protein
MESAGVVKGVSIKALVTLPVGQDNGVLQRGQDNGVPSSFLCGKSQKTSDCEQSATACGGLVTSKNPSSSREPEGSCYTHASLQAVSAESIDRSHAPAAAHCLHIAVIGAGMSSLT